MLDPSSRYQVVIRSSTKQVLGNLSCVSCHFGCDINWCLEQSGCEVYCTQGEVCLRLDDMADDALGRISRWCVGLRILGSRGVDRDVDGWQDVLFWGLHLWLWRLHWGVFGGQDVGYSGLHMWLGLLDFNVDGGEDVLSLWGRESGGKDGGEEDQEVHGGLECCD